MWFAADQFRRYDKTKMEVEEETDRVRVTFTYGLVVVPATKTKVVYEVTADGKIGVKAHYFGKEGLPKLPAAGEVFERE